MTLATWQAAQPLAAEIAPLTLADDLLPAEGEMVAEARMLGVDAEAVFRAALARAVGEAKARRWRQANRKAMEEHGEWVLRHGLPLGRPRAF